MVELICPTTGTVIRVQENMVDKLEKSGYKKADQKKPTTRNRKKANEEKAE